MGSVKSEVEMAKVLARRAANAPRREPSPEAPATEWRWCADGWGSWSTEPPLTESFTIAAPDTNETPKAK